MKYLMYNSDRARLASAMLQHLKDTPEVDDWFVSALSILSCGLDGSINDSVCFIELVPDEVMAMSDAGFDIEFWVAR